jgi:hypothetical protein
MAVSNKIRLGWILPGLLILSVLWPAVVQGQHQIEENPAVESMLQTLARQNKARETVKAWRVQIAAMTDRRKMETEMTRFRNLYPYYSREWIYDNPYYLLKLKGKAYVKKLDALTVLHELKDEYPSAIVVLDDIKREDLLKMTSQ